MISSRPWHSWRITAGLLLLAGLLTAVLLLLAPSERTLGEGIRVVYIHVALVWTGMAALYLTGLLGLVVAATGFPGVSRWMQALAWVGFFFYVLSAIVSLIAQEVNWGGISWQEPRTVAMFQILALALIVRVLNSWTGNRRVQGVLNLLVAGALFWSSRTTSLQLHPDDAVGSSTAQDIRFTFFALNALYLFVAAWLALYWQPRLPGSARSGRTGAPAARPTDG
jgi:hypothetical protein